MREGFIYQTRVNIFNINFKFIKMQKVTQLRKVMLSVALLIGVTTITAVNAGQLYDSVKSYV
jgi:uncharacterized membrane protein YwzB